MNFYSKLRISLILFIVSICITNSLAQETVTDPLAKQTVMRDSMSVEESDMLIVEPRVVDCPATSISPYSLTAGSGAGQLYPSVSVSTLGNCTTYTVTNNYSWVSYIKSGLNVTFSVQANSGPARTAYISIGSSTGSVTLTIYQACGNLPMKPLSISTNRNNFCSNSGGTITLTADGGSGTSTRWFRGSCGGFEVGSTDGPSITIPAPSTTTTYYGCWETSCGSSTCKSVIVNVYPVPTPGSISGSTTFCPGRTITYSVASIAGATYTWTKPAEAIGSSTTNTIDITFGSIGGNISVTATDPSTGCTSAPSTLVVSPYTLTSYSVTGGGTTCPGNIFSIGLMGATIGVTYKCYFNGNWQSGDIIVEDGTNNVRWNKSAPGTYTINGVNGTCEIPMGGSAVISNYSYSEDPTSITASASTICPGAGTTLTVNGGSLGSNANWYWFTEGCGQGTPFSVGTSPTINVNPTETTTYWVKPIGLCGTNHCASIEITVVKPPVISIQPASVTVCDGAPASFSVSASGSNTYQWQSKPVAGNWADIPGATSTSYSVSSTSGMNGKGYRCLVTNSCFTTTSNGAYINFSYLYPYSIQSQKTTICPQENNEITLNGSTLSNPKIMYSCYFNGEITNPPVEGTGGPISFGNHNLAGVYTIKALNTDGCLVPMEGSITLNVNSLPQAGTITGTPNVYAGQGGYTYSVPAISGASGYSWTLPSGATITSGDNTNTIVVEFLYSAISGAISVSGTNSCGPGASSPNYQITVDATYQPLIYQNQVNPLLRTITKSAQVQVGSMPGEVVINSIGAATYGIPIFISPGSAGMQPSISIVYNSMSKDGLLGRGWDLAGLSAIQRVPQDFYHDGKVVGVSLQNTDMFALDSNRLVLSSGTYGADGSIYATEIATFVKVTAHGTAGSGPSWFEVQTKDGRTLEYGNTTDSKILAQSSSTVYQWKLSRIKDQNGNYMDYSYLDSRLGSNIDKIKYTGNLNSSQATYNTVKFSYGSRTDQNTIYSGGNAVTSRYLLTSIRMETEGNALVREYQFKYNLDFYTHLNEVVEYGSDNSAINSTAIGWGGTKSIIKSNDLLSISNNKIYNFYPGDFNGDGRKDLVLTEKKASFTSSDKWELWLADTSGNAFTKKNDGFLSTTFGTFYVSDVDGDGADDLHWKEFVSGQVNFLTYSYSQATGLVRGNASHDIILPSADPGEYILPADFDGNGKNDYLVLYSSKSFVQARVDGIPNFGMVFSSPNDVSIIDFDGDGRQEVLVIKDNNSWVYQYSTTTQTFSTIYTSSSFPTKDDRIFPGDFNGDKKTDILSWNSIQGWTLKYSNGSSFVLSTVPSLQTTDPNASLVNNNIYVSDLNGDGKSDIVESYNSGSNTLKVYYSQGNSSFVCETPTFTKSTNQDYFQFADLNGDGKNDLFYYDNSVASNRPNICFFHKYEIKHLVSSISNGLDVRTKITYARYNSETNGTMNNLKYSDAIFPVIDYFGPLYVVTKVEYDNGHFDYNETDYVYFGAKLHKQGRGFLGFIRRYQPTVAKNRLDEQISELNSSYYFLSPKETYYLNSAGDNDTVTIHKYSNYVKNLGGSTFFPYIGKKIEINKLLETTTTSTYSYDTYGNMTRAKTIHQNDEQGVGVEAIKTSKNDYGSYGNYGILNKITLTTDSSTYTNQPVYIRAKSYSYDGYGRLQTEIQDPGTAKPVTTTYSSFNSAGLPTNVTISSPGLTSKTTLLEYDSKNRFVTKKTDPLNNFTSSTYYPGTGNISTETSIDGLTTTYLYDGFGRNIETITPLLKHITKNYNWKGIFIGYTCSLYRITTDADDLPASNTYYDRLGREMRSEIETPGGIKKEDKFYKSNGQLDYETFPYLPEESSSKSRYLKYDYYGRVDKDSISSKVYTSYSFNGKTTTSSRGNYQSSTKTNSLGNVILSINNGASVSTSYYSNGQKKQMNADGTIVDFTYDDYGRPYTVSNPNSGLTTYSYNAFGELETQLDANGNTTTLHYDVIGRLTSKQTVEGLTNYIYVPSGNGKGQIQSITAPNNTSQSYEYDSYGRPIQSTESIQGDQSFSTGYAYDNWNNLTTTTYPSGYSTTNVYTNGYLTSIKKADNTIIWKLDSINGLGRPVQFTLGTSMTQKFGYDYYGKLTSKKINNMVQTYLYNDTTESITERQIKRIAESSKSETFKYDQLDRLLFSTGPNQSAIHTNYDARGNISSKSGIGNYVYNGTKLNRLDSILVDTLYSEVPDHDITYNSENLTSSIDQGTFHLDFLYGPTGDRIRTILTENGSVVKTKYFIPGYEKDVTDTTTRQLHYLYSPYGLFAIMIKQGATETMYYVETDNLGSIISLLKPDGSYAEKYLYDAWGRRRNPADWTYDNIPSTFKIDRGFTGHEHLDEFGLINMNGRMYDPYIGRFLGVDPFIQELGNSQSFNGYSYCINNPLKYSDPSGMLKKLPEEILPLSYRSMDYDMSREFANQPIGGGFIGEEEWNLWMEYTREGGTGDYSDFDADVRAQKKSPSYNGTIVVQIGWTDWYSQCTSKDGSYKGPVSYIYSSPLYSTIRVQQGNSDLDNWKTNFWNAATLTANWLVGGNQNFTFKNDPIANAFRNATGIVKARNDYYNNGKTEGLVGFGLKGLYHAGLDPIEQFVGSYRYKIDVVGNDLQFTIINQTSFASAAYHIWPYSWNWTNGPMGTVRQTYIFTEPIKTNK